MASSTSTLSLLSAFFLVLLVLDTTNAKGLKLGFYNKACPSAELIIQATTYKYLSKTPTLAAPLLRMHFHDCFVRGCDGSVLLNSTSNSTAERDTIPNASLRGFQVIDAAKAQLEKVCPGVVSCADIVAIAARDATVMARGPFWYVPTGRRDGRISLAADVVDLPSPFANISSLKQSFLGKGLTVKDLAVLSGGHTIGIAHCPTFSTRLYNFTGKGDTDPTLDPKYIAKLKIKCNPTDLTTSVEMDPGSFKTFDDDYYTVVAKKRGLFVSDASLLNDAQTRAYVNFQAITHGSTFFHDFAVSMVKMGNIGVLTGNNGEIRKQCALVN